MVSSKLFISHLYFLSLFVGDSYSHDELLVVLDVEMSIPQMWMSINCRIDQA